MPLQLVAHLYFKITSCKHIPSRARRMTLPHPRWASFTEIGAVAFELNPA
jgi:hypothetical protein